MIPERAYCAVGAGRGDATYLLRTSGILITGGVREVFLSAFPDQVSYTAVQHVG